MAGIPPPDRSSARPLFRQASPRNVPPPLAAGRNPSARPLFRQTALPPDVSPQRASPSCRAPQPPPRATPPTYPEIALSGLPHRTGTTGKCGPAVELLLESPIRLVPREPPRRVSGIPRRPPQSQAGFTGSLSAQAVPAAESGPVSSPRSHPHRFKTASCVRKGPGARATARFRSPGPSLRKRTTGDSASQHNYWK